MVKVAFFRRVFGVLLSPSRHRFYILQKQTIWTQNQYLFFCYALHSFAHQLVLCQWNDGGRVINVCFDAQELQSDGDPSCSQPSLPDCFVIVVQRCLWDFISHPLFFEVYFVFALRFKIILCFAFLLFKFRFALHLVSLDNGASADTSLASIKLLPLYPRSCSYDYLWKCSCQYTSVYICICNVL